MFWPLLFQGDAPEGSDIPMASNQKRSCGRIKAYNMGQGEGPTVPIQTDAPEESYLWTAWQLFPLDDD